MSTQTLPFCQTKLSHHQQHVHMALLLINSQQSVLDINTGNISLLPSYNFVVVIVLQMQRIQKLALGLFNSLNDQHDLYVGNIRDRWVCWPAVVMFSVCVLLLQDKYAKCPELVYENETVMYELCIWPYNDKKME